MKKIVLMLILVLTTVFVNAQAIIYHATSFQLGKYDKKLKKWNFDQPFVNEVSIIFNEGIVYVSDVNNSRYTISDEINDISDEINIIYAINGFDNDKKKVLIFLIKNKVTEEKNITIYWNKSQSTLKYIIKND